MLPQTKSRIRFLRWDPEQSASMEMRREKTENSLDSQFVRFTNRFSIEKLLLDPSTHANISLLLHFLIFPN
jgi:hypothetical protein